MPYYSLCQTVGADMPSRFSVNSVRVSRERYERIRDAAIHEGRLECLRTVGKQFPGGRIRRKNYASAFVPRTV